MFDRVLAAVGRRPNGDRIGAEAAGVSVDARGFVPVDAQQRTNVPHIFAIGDLCGAPMLAHKAMHVAKVAAEVAAGHKAAFDARAIPSVAYTDPGGLGRSHRRRSGTARCRDREGVVRVGGERTRARHRAQRRHDETAVPGRNRSDCSARAWSAYAGELIAELVLAIELGADVWDVALTVHPHPSLSETIGLAAEVAAGTVTDILKR